MWLSESDDGYWPDNIQTFFDNTEGELEDNLSLRLTTRIPLENAYDHSQPFLHGKKPV